MQCKKTGDTIVILVEDVSELETAPLKLINIMQATVSDETITGFKVCLDTPVVEALFPGETDYEKINSFVKKHFLTALMTKPQELDLPFRFFKIPVAGSSDSK